MGGKLRILFIEDSVEDAELEERRLLEGGLSFVAKRVQTREELVSALREFEPDLVISDYSLPALDGLAALKIVRELRPRIPFIFVSGTIGEERAIESLKEGATDYVVKDRLGGLVSKVRRALKESEDRAEHQKLEEQFRQAQKMEAVGRLAGGVAHDFNNFLTVISGYGNLALERLGREDPVREMIQEMNEAAQKAAHLTRQLLVFSRKQVSQPKLLDLNAVVNGVEKMLRRLIGEDIELVTVPGANLWRVNADPGHIEQVILNLAVNARDAMPNGGRLTIETENIELNEDYAKVHPQACPGPHVLLSVRDTGVGMDEEVLAHLFEPFFTTKEPGKGTGLGLSTVHGIVRQSGGHIEVESEMGKGATFKVYLPRAPEGAKTDRKVRAPSPGDLRGSETLLLAEDSDSVRGLCEALLGQAGYRLLVAPNGEEALRISQGHPEVIHLLLTDTIMPGMGGTELARHVTKARPETKVLFMSGYIDRGIDDQGLRDLDIAFLEKPFTMEVLLRKVREVLDAR